jgi:cytochrome c-type biogenesis protein CcmH
MKLIFAVLAALCLIHPALSKEAAPLAEDPAVEKRLVNIAEELRCLVCQNESLAGSQADLAKDLREEVRGLIKSGKSDEEVKDFLVSRYGDFVLYRPQVKPIT